MNQVKMMDRGMRPAHNRAELSSEETGGGKLEDMSLHQRGQAKHVTTTKYDTIILDVTDAMVEQVGDHARVE